MHGESTGFLDVARDLDQEIPDSDDNYSCSLLIATRTRIHRWQNQKDYKISLEDSWLLCSVLDIVRAVPYTVHGAELKLKDAQVLELCK